MVFGQASGGLVSRDFDSMTAYEDWVTNHPDLAASLPTVETRRGRHVYCRTDTHHIAEIRARLGKPDGTGAINCLDGELRAGVGCYSVVPPSQHPSGSAYRWLNPLGELPILNLEESGFVILTGDTEKTEDPRGALRNTEAVEGGREGECVSAWDASRKMPWSEEIEQAIIETLPTRQGMRNNNVFELARTLKAIPQLADVLGTTLRPYVRCWHKMALPVIGTKPFEETWIDFLKGWPRVKFPKGSDPMAAALANAVAAKMPAAAVEYEQEQLRLLVSLSRELQRVSGDSPFFLSCRTAGRLLGVPFKTANRWLFLLVEERVLELVTKGDASSMLANRYRYIADL